MARTLHYTKLGTFKCMEFELPEDTFLKSRENLIIKDSRRNHIYHFPETDRYSIKYKNRFYDLYYGNEEKNYGKQLLIEKLERLCELSVLFDRGRKPNPKRQYVIDNGNNDIFHDEMDKKVYLDYLEEQYEQEHPNLVDTTIREYKDDFFEKDDPLGNKYGIRAGLIWLINLLIASICFMTSIFTIGYIMAGLCAFTTIDLIISSTMYTNFKGILMAILNTLGLPIRFIKKIIKRSKDKKEYNDRVTNVKNALYRKEGSNEFDYEHSKKKEIVDTEGYLINYSEMLKNKILSIKDNSIRKKISKELILLTNNLIKDYKKVKEIEDMDNIKNQYKHWLDGINARADMILEKEKEKENIENQFNTVIENIEAQKVMVKGK